MPTTLLSPLNCAGSLYQKHLWLFPNLSENAPFNLQNRAPPADVVKTLDGILRRAFDRYAALESSGPGLPDTFQAGRSAWRVQDTGNGNKYFVCPGIFVGRWPSRRRSVFNENVWCGLGYSKNSPGLFFLLRVVQPSLCMRDRERGLNLYNG